MAKDSGLPFFCFPDSASRERIFPARARAASAFQSMPAATSGSRPTASRALSNPPAEGGENSGAN